MAFDTYTEIVVGADEVEELIAQNQGRLNRARAEFSAIVSAMTALATQYGPIVAASNSQVTADPTNVAKINLKAHISQLLTDFNTLQSEASALDVLVNPAP